MAEIQTYLSDILHIVAQWLLAPDIILLLAFIGYALFCIGSLIVEVFTERKHFKVVMPKFLNALIEADEDGVPAVIEESGLLKRQKQALLTVYENRKLPGDALLALVKREVEQEESRYDAITGRNNTAARVAPMLGLMGTLIPLGPGIEALGRADTAALSSSLLVAFDTTVAGLVVAAVCLVIGKIRSSWYEDYLSALDAAMATMMEKTEGMKVGERKVVLYVDGQEFELTHAASALPMAAPGEKPDHGSQPGVSGPKDEAAEAKAGEPDATAEAGETADETAQPDEAGVPADEDSIEALLGIAVEAMKPDEADAAKPAEAEQPAIVEEPAGIEQLIELEKPAEAEQPSDVEKPVEDEGFPRIESFIGLGATRGQGAAPAAAEPLDAADAAARIDPIAASLGSIDANAEIKPAIEPQDSIGLLFEPTKDPLSGNAEPRS